MERPNTKSSGKCVESKVICMQRVFTIIFSRRHSRCKLVDDCYRAGIGRDEKIIGEALLKKIHCPAFILHGVNDPMVKKEQAEYLSRNLIDSEVHYFPKASHNCHQTHAKEFNSLVTMFLLE